MTSTALTPEPAHAAVLNCPLPSYRLIVLRAGGASGGAFQHFNSTPSSSRPCDEKDAAEGQQGTTIRLLLVGGRNASGIGSEEGTAIRFIEHIEVGSQSSALGPVEDRVVTFEDVEVFALPDIDPPYGGGEYLIIDRADSTDRKIGRT
jgi:hypothetical protein